MFLYSNVEFTHGNRRAAGCFQPIDVSTLNWNDNFTGITISAVFNDMKSCFRQFLNSAMTAPCYYTSK